MTKHFRCKFCEIKYPQGVYFLMSGHLIEKHPKEYMKMLMNCYQEE